MKKALGIMVTLLLFFAVLSISSKAPLQSALTATAQTHEEECIKSETTHEHYAENTVSNHNTNRYAHSLSEVITGLFTYVGDAIQNTFAGLIR